MPSLCLKLVLISTSLVAGYEGEPAANIIEDLYPIHPHQPTFVSTLDKMANEMGLAPLNSSLHLPPKLESALQSAEPLSLIGLGGPEDGAGRLFLFCTGDHHNA